MVLGDRNPAVEWWIGALVAVHSHAKAAINANGRDCTGFAKIAAIGIHQLAGVIELTADANGMLLLGYFVACPHTAYCSGNREVAGAVFHFNNLRDDFIGRAKGFMNAPPRTGPAKTRKMKARSTKAVGAKV